MRAEIRDAAAATIVALLAFVLALGMVAGRGKSDLVFYGCALATSGLALAAGALATSPRHPAVVPILVLGAVLLRLWFVAQTPSLSGDIYRYIWDGRIVNAGFNPYLHVPADPALVSLRDPEQFQLIDKRDYAVTIYPPVAQALFAIVTRFSTSVWAMKLAMVFCEIAAVGALAQLMRRLGKPIEGLVVYLLHPAGIWEIAGNGHVDAAMMALLFGAFAIPAWRGERYGSAALVTLAALIKPTAALGLPSLWRPVQALLPLFVVAVAAVCYLPFLSAGAHVIGFLPNYAHEQGLDSGHGFYWLELFNQLGLPTQRIVPLYEACAALLLILLAIWLRRRGGFELPAQLRATAVLLIGFMLLLTPVFPWYWLALLPFTPLLGLWTPFVFATGGFLLYSFNADAPPFFFRWSVLMGCVILAVIRDAMAARKESRQ